MSLRCKIPGKIGGKRTLADAAFRIGDDDDWHEIPPLTLLLAIHLKTRLRVAYC
jgi:hypothetical protein